jgi:3-hydroxyisobutyrate dehydrogenase-like beta-hydroxyacid dehydrogenase
MGSALARTLVKDRRGVTVRNRTPERSAPLVELEAKAADGLAAGLRL